MAVLHLILVFSTWKFTAACQTLTVSGAVAQKGVEGEYGIQSTCTDIGDSVLYIQTAPAAGWGSVFYLYHYDTQEDWKGWMFSLYPCSDIPFVKTESNASSPVLVHRPWEEFMMDTFIANPELKVQCKGEFPVFWVVVFAIVSLLLVIGLILLPVLLNSLTTRKTTSQCDVDDSNMTRLAERCGDVYIPHLPQYSDVVTESRHTPPAYHDIHTPTHSVNTPLYHANPPPNDTSAPHDVNNNNHMTVSASRIVTDLSPPSYAEALHAKDKNEEL